jgi:hypothetical protein
MLKRLNVLLSLIVIGLAICVIISKNFIFLSLELFVLGGILLISGSLALKEKQKANGIMSFLTASFVLFVAIYTFITYSSS